MVNFRNFNFQGMQKIFFIFSKNNFDMNFSSLMLGNGCWFNQHKLYYILH